MLGSKLAHRIIYEMFNGPIPKGYVVDHIDRNKLNNRIDNLRLATISQNAVNASYPNRKVYPWSVQAWPTFLKRESGKWIVTVTKDRKRESFKSESILEAIKWRDARSKALHGEYFVAYYE